MNTAQIEIREPDKLEVVLTLRGDIKDFRFFAKNPHKCPGNEWIFEAVEELLERADKEIFIIKD